MYPDAVLDDADSLFGQVDLDTSGLHTVPSNTILTQMYNINDTRSEQIILVRQKVYFAFIFLSKTFSLRRAGNYLN